MATTHIIALQDRSAGGFAEEEVAAAEAAGFERMSMGPRVLRTETAALAALSVMQFRFGDMPGDFFPDSQQTVD